VDPRKMQIYISGFMEKDTATFMEELWNLLIEA
jgi:serine/arginine repetitive matrix protein 1